METGMNNEELREDGGQSERKKRGGKHRARWIILGVVLIVIALLAVRCSTAGREAGNTIAKSDTELLQTQDFMNTVSATGTVESTQTNYVYSTQAYQVLAVHADVGDKVQAGDLLCELDGSVLEDQIEAKELANSVSEKAAKQQVKTARDSYNAAKSALNSGANAGIISAQSGVQNAYDAWQKAIRTYNNYIGGTNATVVAQNNAVASARNSVDLAKSAYQAALNGIPDNNISVDDPLPASYSSLLPQKTAYDNAQISLATANAQSAAAQNTADATLVEYQAAMDSAYNAYLAAQKQLNAAEVSAKAQLQSSQNALESAQIGANTDVANLTVEQLRESLEDTRIKAPISGTVTAAYAKVGANGTGLLFVIEDTDHLQIDTTVKAYDIGSVKEGLPVIIKSDSTGDQEFQGTIESIAPTSLKNSLGQTDTASSDVLFDTKVAVTSPGTGLRIGMSARLTFVLDEQKGVLSVPYDAVYTNAAGQTCILAAEQASNGKYRIRELPVTQGIENDLYVVISGGGVKAGLIVITAPDKYRAKLNAELTLADTSSASSAARAGFGFGGGMRG